MLTDHELHDLADRMNIPLEGVYFKNEIPKIKTNKAYIINLQDSENDEGEQNQGTHWTYFQIAETPNGNIEPFYFDPYGVPPPEAVKNAVKKQFNKHLPYSDKDIQSLMNNACGYYCLAIGHYLNAYKERSGYLYTDANAFLDLFDDLNASIDWKKNEYILKLFFLSEDPTKRKNVDVFDKTEYDRIVSEDQKGGMDVFKVDTEYKLMNKK